MAAALPIDVKSIDRVKFSDMARELAESHRPRHPVADAIEWAGGVALIAVRTGLTRQTLYDWIKGEAADPEFFRRIGYERVLALAEATGMPPWVLTGVSRWSLDKCPHCLKLASEPVQIKKKSPLTKGRGN